MPLRLSALFFRILRYFFHSFVAAEQKKEVLPLMILSNHFETAPFFLKNILNLPHFYLKDFLVIITLRKGDGSYVQGAHLR